MSIWLELRCENRTSTTAYSDSDHSHACFSHRNEGPMQMASDTKENVITTFKDIEKMAKKKGWVKTDIGWICPFCASVLFPKG